MNDIDKELRRWQIYKEPRRWQDVSHYGFGYTKCPYCGDETGWYNPGIRSFQTDFKNNIREHCPKCGERVYASVRWIMNQPDKSPEDIDWENLI